MRNVYQNQMILLVILFQLFHITPLLAQKQMELLDRGLVAVRTSGSSVYIGWRMFGTDPDQIAFNVYRNNVKITGSPVSGSTNYIDANGSTSALYHITPVINGVEGNPTGRVSVWDQQYKILNLNRPAAGSNPSGSYQYYPNDCSVADLDGDGEYEIIIKWEPDNAKDNSQSGYTGNTYLEAIKLDGRSLWRIDLGKNIRSGAHYTQFLVYDFEGDGLAEVVCKTAPGTIDGKGKAVIMNNDNPNADYRNSSGYILSGPEYLTVFDGQTGAERATSAYIPARGTVSSWGDNYGNRVDRFLGGVAYLDGKRPSIVMARGYYTRMVVATWDFRDGRLTHRWTFDTNNGHTNLQGKGNHQLSIADVDNDGKDEIIYGAVVIDDNGSVKNSSTWGHGDALHVSDFNPDNPGLEIFMPVEYASSNPQDQRPGFVMRDANTGRIIWQVFRDGDIGRGICANIDPRYPGAECWAAGGAGLYDSKGNVIGNTPSGCNFAIWWDADLTRELLDGDKLDKWNTAGNGSNSRLYTLYQQNGATKINGTKANPCLQADILGDWREELLYRNADGTQLMIFTTVNHTSHRLYTLMHDPQYRCAIAWQNVGYNQPPHPSFYIGEDMAPAPKPNIYLIGRGGQTPNYDCAGIENGNAVLDDCGRCVGGATGSVPCSGIVQAENACEFIGVTETVNGGFIGESYVNCHNETGAYITWVLNAPEQTSIALNIRYANGGGSARSANLLVNGQPAGLLAFSPTSAWTDWRFEQMQVQLNKGPNQISISPVTSDGNPNIDLIYTTEGIVAGSCETDCENVMGGLAYLDNCNQCVGGNTGREACIPDCNGVYNGNATIDECGVCVGGTTGRQACTDMMEAELACYIDGVTEAINGGFFGDGYANTHNVSDAYISWQIIAEQDVTVPLTIRFANGTTSDRNARIVVNEATVHQNISFPVTGAWNNWQTTTLSIPLEGGVNTVELIAVNPLGLANIDRLSVSNEQAAFGFCTVTAIRGNNKLKAELYPNPFNSTTSIICPGVFDYVIYDINGRFIESGTAADRIDTGHDLPKGIYLIKIQQDSFITHGKVTKL